LGFKLRPIKGKQVSYFNKQIKKDINLSLLLRPKNMPLIFKLLTKLFNNIISFLLIEDTYSVLLSYRALYNKGYNTF
jgi:hypothetical protein